MASPVLPSGPRAAALSTKLRALGPTLGLDQGQSEPRHGAQGGGGRVHPQPVGAGLRGEPGEDPGQHRGGQGEGRQVGGQGGSRH